MSERPIDEMLRDLRHEIERAEGLQDELRDDLREAVVEIEASVSEPGGLAARAGERLAERALALEAAHPALTEVLDRVMRQLSRMGI